MLQVKSEKELKKLGMAIDPNDTSKVMPLNGKAKRATTPSTRRKRGNRAAKVLSGAKETQPTTRGAAKNSVNELCNTIRNAAQAIDKADLDITVMERVRATAYSRLGVHLLALRKVIPGGWRKKGEGIVGPSKFQRAVDIACYFGGKELDKQFTSTLTGLLELIVTDKDDNPSKYPWQHKAKPKRAKTAAAAGKKKPAKRSPEGGDVGDDDADSDEEGEQDQYPLPRFALEDGGKDEFYTPDNVTSLILPYLPKGKVIWEFAWGLGHMARCLQSHGHTVVGGPDVDFLGECVEADILITNPPFSKKDAFLERAYSLGKPFAMILPADALVGLERFPLFSSHGIQLLIPNKRITFICKADSSAMFNTVWYCWKLLPKDIVFAELPSTLNGQGGVQ